MAEDTKNPKDVVVLGPNLDNQGHPFIRQCEDGSTSVGIFHPMAEGQSADFADEVVQLTHRGPGSIFDVETLYKRPSGDGPAMVNSQEYMSGWDRIFGKQEIGEA